MCAVSILPAAPDVKGAGQLDQAAAFSLPPAATSPDADPLEAALAYAAAGWWVFPVAPGGRKLPLIGAWQHEHGTPEAAADACQNCRTRALQGLRPKHRDHGATRNPDTIRRWWAWWPRAAVGLSHRLSGTLSLDIDFKPGRDGWATLDQLKADGLDLPATPGFRTASGGGQLIMARPPDLAGLAGNHAGAHGPGVDLVLGFSLLPSGTATPGRVWDTRGGLPPAPAPGWTVAKRRGGRAGSAARAEAVARCPVPVELPGEDRATTYLRAAFDVAAANVAALPEGERQDGLHGGAVGLGFALARVERPDLNGAALEVLASAAPWADTPKERDTIARGIAWGLEHGRPGLPDRADWSPAALPPGGLAEGEAVPDPEEVRAAAFAMLADLPELVAGLTDAEGRPIHPNARLTVELVAGELCRQAIDTGRPWVLASPAALGLERDRGPDSVRRAGPWLDRLGWTLTPGGWTDDGTPKAAHYSLSGIFPTRCGDSVSRGGDDGDGGLDVLTATCRKNAPEVLDRAAITLARGAVAGSDLSRGMRRRLGVRPAEGEDTRPKAAGGTIHKLLEALPRIGEADAGQLADAAGVSRRTVERNAGRLVERGAWTRRTAPAPGRGRPRVLYAVADQAGPLVAATIEAGRRAKAKAQAAIEAFRDLCRRALAAVERGLYATHRAAVSALARIVRRRAAAERDAALPGRARQLGRTDADERAAALKETRAWGVTLRQCQAIRSTVELDPPGWATAPTACTAELGI